METQGQSVGSGIFTAKVFKKGRESPWDGTLNKPVPRLSVIGYEKKYQRPAPQFLTQIGLLYAYRYESLPHISMRAQIYIKWLTRTNTITFNGLISSRFFGKHGLAYKNLWHDFSVNISRYKHRCYHKTNCLASQNKNNSHSCVYFFSKYFQLTYNIIIKSNITNLSLLTKALFPSSGLGYFTVGNSGSGTI